VTLLVACSWCIMLEWDARLTKRMQFSARRSVALRSAGRRGGGWTLLVERLERPTHNPKHKTSSCRRLCRSCSGCSTLCTPAKAGTAQGTTPPARLRDVVPARDPVPAYSLTLRRSLFSAMNLLISSLIASSFSHCSLYSVTGNRPRP